MAQVAQETKRPSQAQLTESRAAALFSYKPLLKRFALKFCVAVTIGVALLIAGEFVAYLKYDAHPHENIDLAMREVTPNTTPSQREYWKEFKESNQIEYHPYVLWRRQPYTGEQIHVDGDGIRRTLHSTCDGRQFTIWMFGDSTMWGAGAPDAETIPSLIAAKYENSGRKVCVVNYGEKGWVGTQEIIQLMLELSKPDEKRPDEVVFYDGSMESYTAYQSGIVDVHASYHRFKAYIEGWKRDTKPGFAYLQKTNTYHALEGIAEKLSPAKKPEGAREYTPQEIASLADAVVENYIGNIDLVDALAEHYHFRPVFIWHPNIDVGHKHLTPEEERLRRMEQNGVPGLDALFRASYARAAHINRPDFYDFGDLLDDRNDTLYVEATHLGPEGNRIIADRVFQILEQRPSGPPGSP